MDVMQLIVEEGLIMIVVLWIIGYFCKSSKLIKVELIPFVLLSISLMLTPYKLGEYTADSIIQSILVTGIAVLGHEVITKREKLIG